MRPLRCRWQLLTVHVQCHTVIVNNDDDDDDGDDDERWVNDSAYHFSEDVGHGMSDVSTDSQQVFFIIQQLSNTIQHLSSLDIYLA